jgi:alpha-L-fucosidase 2
MHKTLTRNWLIGAMLLGMMTAALPGWSQTSPAIQPIANVSALMPAHGTVSTQPATRWEDALAAGNGIQGALLYGDPTHDTLIADHCSLWLPLGSREILPVMGNIRPEMRRIIGTQGYQAGQDYFLAQAKKKGWGGNITWTDKFHPGFFLNITQPQTNPITQYARVENFATGETWAQWHSNLGDFTRRMFVSKPDNVTVVTTTGPKASVSLQIAMQPIANDLITSTVVHSPQLITCHNVYVNGKGGYDGAIRVVSVGGTETSDGHSISVNGADSVTLILRIQPWKTPLKDSEAWAYSPNNPNFARSDQISGLYRAANEYQPHWMDDLIHSLAVLPTDYQTLLAPQKLAWGKIYNRVSIDLNGSTTERGMSSEALLTLAQKDQRLSPALLERMYDAGRYVFLCSAGPQTPPNLFGIWTGTWNPAWSGDYTTDTNLELDVECADSCNMSDCMQGYFNLWDSYVPDFQRNARDLYDCRGILTGTRESNTGLDLHWASWWPGNLWTPGAAWIAHWYYDYYQYTGDKKFLRDRAIPFMEQCAYFYEDFLKGSVDSTGHYTFRPSFSAENGWGDNASQDIEISHELLTNLIAGCETLGIKQQDVKRWKAMLAKMPPLLINSQGQLKEWSNPTQGEKNNHRHLMHLYGAFESGQFTPEADPVLFAAARVALTNRVNASTEDATHGFMHTALAATGLGMGDLAYSRVEQLAKRRSIFLNMVDGHYGGPSVLCDDGNGATPEVVNRMIVQSQMGRVMFLPALPSELPMGTLRGTRLRGAITLNRITWNTQNGTLTALLTADNTQKVHLVMPPKARVDSLTINGRAQRATSQGVRKLGCVFVLPKGKTILVHAKFHFDSHFHGVLSD